MSLKQKSSLPWGEHLKSHTPEVSQGTTQTQTLTHVDKTENSRRDSHQSMISQSQAQASILGSAY